MNNLITSSGIIRNREQPRTGVISANSVNFDFLDEIIIDGIDLSYESARAELEAAGKTDDEIDEELDFWEGSSEYLYGDWVKNAEGKYEINQNGKHGFAISYNTERNTLCVEWSKTTKPCHHTSPCYVMSDGSGPCGDLDTEGDAVIAFSLPEEVLK